jgi:hypothetical protein
MRGRALGVRAVKARDSFGRVVAVTLAALLCASAKAHAASPVPLPSDTEVISPATDIAPEISAFSGKWVGRWDDTLEHVLVVERIAPPEVTAIYAFGEAATWGISKANFHRVDGRIEACTLTLTLKRPATVTYRMQSNGTLDASYEWSNGIVRAILKRIDQGTSPAPKELTIGCPPVARAVIPKLSAHFKGRWEMTSSTDYNQYSQTTGFEIATQDDYGNITGFFMQALPRFGTRPELMCVQAYKLPMTGIYDGRKLVLSIKFGQNGPGCQDRVWTLFRGKDHQLERKAKDGSWYYYYDPAD